MKTLHIEKAIPYTVPPIRTIVLVGCGGTGSHIAQSLTRMCSTLTPVPWLVFVDGDIVEHKNVGRQLFSVADVGKYKSLVLAARFASLFGIPIRAAHEYATGDMLVSKQDGYTLYIGAVDNAAARQVIADAQAPGQTLWLDAGNHQHSGQVGLGTATERRQLDGCLRLGSLCTLLPAPSLVYHDLLDPAEHTAAHAGACAEAMEANLQSLMVNQMIAAIAAEYLYKLLVLHQVTTFTTEVDLTSLSMRSTPITHGNLSEYMEEK